jgi:tetratricopeptide (TPR) repeat protein
VSLWSRIERRLGEIAGELLPDDHREAVERARAALDAGDAEAAEQTLADVVAARPDYAGALSLLGAAQLALAKPDDALASFEAALAIHDDLPEALIGCGEAALAVAQDTDRRADAISAFRRAIDAAGGDKPILAAAYRGLGLAHLAAGNADKAVRELRKAVTEDPDDVASLTGLGEALLASPDHPAAQARRYLARATDRPDPPAAAWRALGAAELELGHYEAAANAFSQLPDDVVAIAGCGDAAFAGGDRQGAHDHYVRALGLAPRSAELHARVADVKRDAGDLDAALASYDRAVQLGGGMDIVRRALDTALAAGDASGRAVQLANTVLADAADDPRALTARGIALVRDAQLDAARATFGAALAGGDDIEARIALGQLELAEGDGAAAADNAWIVLRIEPRNVRARELLAAARECELSASRDAEPYALAVDLHRLAMARPDLSEIVGDAAQAATDFDQPLLVTVMGEFSSGKSTFINAFVREDVAPTGITPTTATINVLKYGRERGGRIHYQDGRVISLPWPAFTATLRELTADAARDVSSVEILYPLAELERVNIVDTPGLNSILPEHEHVARDFLARADAIVWLFAAGQAGKKTEREALQAMRDEGKRVLGVLNKTDQLSADEVAQLTAHVESELGGLVEVLVPLSARDALASQQQGNWPALAATLEERFFSRARELKRHACDRRLATLIARGRAGVQDRHAAAAAAASSLAAAAASARNDRQSFADSVVPAVRGMLNERSAELYRSAAREVLELVRPRKLPFGSHRAAQSDRDYLLSMLDAGFTSLLEPARARIRDTLTAAGHRAAVAAAREAGVVGPAHVVHVEEMMRDAVRLVDARVFDRADAFVRGYLRGGAVDRFFRQDLPKLELTEDAAYHALFRESPDIDGEVGEPLLASGMAALDALADRLDHLAGVADAIAFDLDAGVERALQQLDDRRRHGPDTTPD